MQTLNTNDKDVATVMRQPHEELNKRLIHVEQDNAKLNYRLMDTIEQNANAEVELDFLSLESLCTIPRHR